MSRVLFRPIEQWPGAFTPARERKSAHFTEEWAKVTADLERELEWLGSHEVVVQLACDESAMRLDGGLRAGANPSHPGVIVSFESKHGPLRYHCDQYDRWRGNLRAISLTLTALRAINRYGAAKANEQYRGWNALPPGGIAVGPAMTKDEAERFLIEMAGGNDDGESRSYQDLWRRAATRHHPDKGGDPAVFRRLTEARDLLVAKR